VTTIALEQLVVVEIVDGVADQTIVHLPRHPNRFDALEWPPVTWPPACLSFRSGGVYAHAGMVADAPVCGLCEATT